MTAVTTTELREAEHLMTFTNEHGAVVATIIPSRRRVANAGWFVRLYTSPDTYSLLHVPSLTDAKMLARDHAETI